MSRVTSTYVLSFDNQHYMCYISIMLKSRIPKEMKKRGLKPQDLVRAGVVTPRIAREIYYEGSVKLRLSTLAKLCELMDVKFLDDLMELK